MLTKLLVTGFVALTILSVLCMIHPILAVLFIIGMLGAPFT